MMERGRSLILLTIFTLMHNVSIVLKFFFKKTSELKRIFVEQNSFSSHSLTVSPFRLLRCHLSKQQLDKFYLNMFCAIIFRKYVTGRETFHKEL